MKDLLIPIALLFMLPFGLSAQEVEHNYLVGPQNTDCDSLKLTDQTVAEKINAIKSAKFRYTQNITLNRKEGFQGGWYYSCDNESGYLVVKRNNQWELYHNVKKTTWQQFIQSGAFEQFIDRNIKPHQ